MVGGGGGAGVVAGGGGGTYGVVGATYGAGVGFATGGEALTTGPPGKSPAARAFATSAPRNTTTLEFGWSTRYRTGRLPLSACAKERQRVPRRKREV